MKHNLIIFFIFLSYSANAQIANPVEPKPTNIERNSKTGEFSKICNIETNKMVLERRKTRHHSGSGTAIAIGAGTGGATGAVGGAILLGPLGWLIGAGIGATAGAGLGEATSSSSKEKRFRQKHWQECVARLLHLYDLEVFQKQEIQRQILSEPKKQGSK